MAKTTKLYVGNLPSDADKDDLEEQFRKFGAIVEFDILKDYGFVHFENEAEAKAAVEAMDGTMHHGNKIRVEMSRSRVRQKAGMGGKGECFRCGREGHWSKECPRGPSRGRGDRYSPYDREPYYPDPYDYYARARMLPPIPYDRYSRYDPYERRLPALPPPDSLYHDFGRASPDYYRRPSPPRDPYYDYYERRRLNPQDEIISMECFVDVRSEKFQQIVYEDDKQYSQNDFSLGGPFRLAAIDAYGDSLGVSSVATSEIKTLTRTALQGRVPGPY